MSRCSFDGAFQIVPVRGMLSLPWCVLPHLHDGNRFRPTEATVGVVWPPPARGRPYAMDLLEYQGKQLFARAGVPVPELSLIHI